MNLDHVRALMNDLIALIKDLNPEIQKLRYNITYKEDNSPVTLADKLIENEVYKFLSKKLDPLVFIGEESFSFQWEEAQDSYIAILDPIDGTENFCSGLKEWGMSFSLWKGTQHLGSLLFLPELNEHIMTGDQVSKIQSRITGFSSSYSQEISDGIKEAQEYRVTGCAVYNLFNVIRGSFKRFVNPKGAYVWDLLPGTMLALEQGCEVKLDGKLYNGELLNPNRKYRIDIQQR